jgi:putative FmdB family regulatory protein
MPIYEYRCDNGHVFDVIQKISDEPLVECQECEAPARRVLHPVAVHFKGSGFYTTDYGRRKAAANGGGAAEDAKGPKESKKSESTPGDSKPAASTASKE